MATPSHDSDPKPVPNNNVVFIDTNLDTHLVIIVSDHDTVSDLKKRILLEHPLCFPKVGQIQIHAIKVKRKGYFYHLLDSMLVRSAFHGFSKSWFLSVDASMLGEHGQNKQLCSAGSPNQVACLTNTNTALIGPVDIAINDQKASPFVNHGVTGHDQNEAGKNLETCATSFRNNDTRFPLPGSILETHGVCYVNHKLPSLPIGCEVDGSGNGVKDDHNVCEGVSSISLVSAKKRQKSKRKKEGTMQDNLSKEKIVSDDNLLSFASKKVSSFNNFEVPQLGNKQDEIKEISLVSSHDSEHAREKLIDNLEMGVKSSGNNNPGIPLPDSILKTQDHHCVNHEHLPSHVGCEVDGYSKGIKDDHIEFEDGSFISMSTSKKKRKGKRKKEDMMQDDTSKENDVCTFGPSNNKVQQGIALITNPSENANKEVINETEFLKEHQHTECNNNDTTKDIVTESMKDTSEALHAANNKSKRKRSLTHDCEEMLEVEASLKVEAQKSEYADANIRGLNMTSKVDAEPVKSKKKRKKRKSKVSDGGPALGEGISPISASESEAIFVKSLKSINFDPASGNTETEENPLNHTTPTTTRCGLQIIQNNAGSMEQIESKADAEQVDKRQSIKPNKQNSALKSVSDVLTKDDVFDSKKPSPSSDTLVDASRSAKITKKSMSVSTKSTGKSSETNLDPVKHSVGLEHLDSQFMAASNGSPQFPSNTHKDSYNLEDAAAKDSTHSPVKQDDNNLEEPLKTHKINAGKQILFHQLQHEANMSDVLVDKMNGSDKEDLDLMNGWNARKAEESKGQTHAESLSSSQQLLSKDEHGVLKIHPDKKVPTVHETGRREKLPSPSYKYNGVSSIREKRKPKVNDSEKLVGSEKRREGLPMSNSMLEGSKKRIQKKIGKASQNNVGKVVGKTQQKKSLLAGAIFQDDSSGTSEYVHEADKSDASTRTPSDNSLVSDFSDSDSSAGSHGGKSLENGGRSALTETMSSARGMPIDHILRSSSRYKKAKITASQLEGTESQPEFVPDSLADM